MLCRFINTGINNAFANMAIDEALLHCCQIPTLRVYQWHPAAVSIGCNQSIQKEINIDHCNKNGITIVRRISGGKAIFHDKELTYSFIIPKKMNLVPENIVESYKIIANALVIGLKKFGISVDIKKVKEKIATPICFNSSNWFELTANSKKISGSAQRRFDGKILQHGSVIIDFDYEKNALLFDSKNEMDTIENLRNRITSLQRELKKEVNIRELANAIKYGFGKNFNFSIFNDALKEKEILLSKRLLEEKYFLQI